MPISSDRPSEVPFATRSHGIEDCTHWLPDSLDHEIVYCIRHGDELPCPTCSKEGQ
jgi:hypothetical protein